MDELELTNLRKCELSHFIARALKWPDMESGVTGLLTEGRFLQSGRQRDEVDEHLHIYRKILADYDSSKQTVLLSKEGSRRTIENLDERDKEFTLQELYDEMWLVKPKEHNVC